MKYLLFIISSLLISSCFSKKEKSELNFQNLAENRKQIELKKEIEEMQKRKRLAEILRIKKLKIARVISDEEIISSALDNYWKIESILKKKCFDCHNSNKKLPYYGRIFKKINPVYHHQRDGLIALDFKLKYPLLSRSNALQISLLRSFRSSILDRTMPIKSYGKIYRKRRLNFKDELAFLSWIDPLINKIENHNERFKELDGDGSLDFFAKSILKERCFRCHANAESQGGFGQMQNFEELIKNSKYVNLENPDQSLIYTLSLSGNMPPSKTETLAEDELDIILDWITTKQKK